MIKDANVYFDEIYHKYVFAYRKYHDCDSALLSLTEQWKKEIDNNKLIGLVSMDFSKAFDTLNHELNVLKLNEFEADEATIPKSETGGYAFQLATYMQWCTTGIHPRPFIIQHLHERSFICHQEVHSVHLR